jgi:iron complex outermembrane recepter protein
LPSTTQLDTGFRQTEYGFYSNDSIDLNRYWHISAGLRYSLFDRDSSQNDVLNSLNQQGAMTYSGGLSFTPLPNLAAYYGYSQSFQANTATDHNLQVLPAKQGELHEVGIKSQWLDKRLGINAALYHLQQTNLPARDPVDPDYSVAIGEIYSQGFEFDAIGQLSQRWQLLSNYSWMEAKFGSGTVLKDNTFRSSPKHSSSLWTRYQLPFQMPGKLFLGAGMVYVGNRFGDDINSFKVPGYLRTDLIAHYQLEKLDFRVKVENLLDKRYVSSSIYDDTVIQGNRLLFQFLLGIRFD